MTHERREGHSKLHGKPLDENGAIELTHEPEEHRTLLQSATALRDYLLAQSNPIAHIPREIWAPFCNDIELDRVFDGDTHERDEPKVVSERLWIDTEGRPRIERTIVHRKSVALETDSTKREDELVHTPTPWTAEVDSLERSLHTIWSHTPEDHSVLVARTCFAPNSKVNAEFIVEACNSYHADQQAMQGLQARVKSLEEDVQVGDQISGSFFEALKRLNLTHLRVGDPGSHVVDLIDERDRLEARVKELEEELRRKA